MSIPATPSSGSISLPVPSMPGVYSPQQSPTTPTPIIPPSSLSSSQSQPKTGSFFDPVAQFFHWLWDKFIGLFVSKEETEEEKAVKDFDAFADLVNSGAPISRGVFHDAWEKLDPFVQYDILRFDMMVYHFTPNNNPKMAKWIVDERTRIASFKDSNEKVDVTSYRYALRCSSLSTAWRATALAGSQLESLEPHLGRLSTTRRKDLALFTIYLHGPRFKFNPEQTRIDPNSAKKGYPFEDITQEMIDEVESTMMAAVFKTDNKSDLEKKATLKAVSQTIQWIISN